MTLVSTNSIACKTRLSSLKVEREEVRHDEETLSNRVRLMLERTATASQRTVT